MRTLKKERKAEATKTTAKADATAPPKAVDQAPASSSQSETFHGPSGNIACRLTTDAAVCSVASMDMTFTLEAGRGVPSQSVGADVPKGSGSVRTYGESVSVGQFTCAMPDTASSPRGVVCTDHDTGHGFEASAKLARQRVY